MLTLNFAQINIQIDADATTRDLLKKNYSGLLNHSAESSRQLSYKTSFQHQTAKYQIAVDGPDKELIEVDTDSDFIYFFEKSLTIQAQKLRPDLFFLHSAALKLGDKTILIMGKSGAGKSTTTYALTHHGFKYLSDELSPVNLDTMMVSPYAHALCLKKTPPKPYTLPETTLKTIRTMHVPVEELKGGSEVCDSPITHVFFVQYNPEQKDVVINTVKKASASIQLYSNGLNHLCHENAGLPAATKIASHCDCYALEFSNVTQACEDLKLLINKN